MNMTPAGTAFLGCLGVVAPSLGFFFLASAHVDMPCCFVLPLVFVAFVLVARGVKHGGGAHGHGSDDEPSSRRCPSCGHPIGNRPRARFCPACGAKLED